MNLRSGVATGSALLGLLTTVPGCSAGDGGTEGDCNIQLSFKGERYVVDSDLSPVALGPSAGTADQVSCSDDDEVLGKVDVHQVQGVSTSTALAVLDGEEEAQEIAVYVRADLPRDEKPSGWPTSTPSE